jgi:hypothetical protein
MTLVKNKSRVTSNQRKMNALHHRQNSRYVRPYLPYLPLFLIMGSSIVASQFLPHGSFNSASNTAYSTRVQSVFGSNSRLLLYFAYLGLAVFVVWFIVRHYKRIRGLIIREEKLLMKHYFLDAILAILIGSMCLLVT